MLDGTLESRNGRFGLKWMTPSTIPNSATATPRPEPQVMIPNHRSAFMRNALKYMKCGMTEIHDNARPRRVVN